MKKCVVGLRVSGDNMEAFMNLAWGSGEGAPLTVEDLQRTLAEAGVRHGVDEDALRDLATASPPQEERLVARGEAAEDGTNGALEFFVTRSDEYKPSYGVDGTARVDYKNVDVFQMVEKGQVLCKYTLPTPGRDGINVFGGAVPARKGREAPSPQGSNTEWSGDGTALLASADGTVDFNGQIVSVRDVLHIPGDVNLSTGNIRFPGDVVVRGSVDENFSVTCGGNLTVRGRIGSAEVQVGGNLLISEGVNGNRRRLIRVGGFMRCRYIENGNISVEGDLFSDYIIDSNVVCTGNINLSGSKAVLVGGNTSVFGELTANYIGNERGVRTRVELLEKPFDEEKAAALIAGRDKLKGELKTHSENAAKVRALMDLSDKPELNVLFKQLTEQSLEVRARLRLIEEELRQARGDEDDRFPGAVVCRRILYSGVDVFAGGLILQRDNSDIEHCRLHLGKGDWVKGLP
jgi:uncharacterized protein (DUF342 family)